MKQLLKVFSGSYRNCLSRHTRVQMIKKRSCCLVAVATLLEERKSFLALSRAAVGIVLLYPQTGERKHSARLVKSVLCKVAPIVRLR
jgi:hypothetical protein